MRAPFLLSLLLLVAACARGSDGAIDVAVIGEPEALFARGNRLAPPGELVRAATMQGLVRLDAAGQLVPGIAERWIVTDDGTSYIFRIREVTLAGGKRVTARTVQQALNRAMRELRGTSLGLDLAQVRDVRAMTGRVIEIRLHSPMPGFLQLLAQPELGIAVAGTPTGPMAMTRIGDSGAVLTPLPPEARGLPAQPDWAETVRAVRLTAGPARRLTEAFSDGRYAVVLGGTLATLPLADVGPLSRGTVRLDSAIGLFGLDVLRDTGFLATAENREALALALDREALIRPFNIAGWIATTRVVAPGLPDDPELVPERWQGMALDARRALAARRVAAWRAANGGVTPMLSLALPPGPGSDTLYAELAGQYREIGVILSRAQEGEDADLALRDRVARYAGARWFLNQFNCRVSAAICSEDVDFLVQRAVDTPDPAAQARHLADAEIALLAYNAFIPIGAPIRWSLVRSGVVGFSENAFAAHPLFALSLAPM
jgi:oligopeptide transport system substrate-binding protein